MTNHIEVLRGLRASIVAAVGDDDPEYVLQLEAIDAGIAALAAMAGEQAKPDPAFDRATDKLRKALAHKDGHHSIGLTKAECAAVLAMLPPPPGGKERG